MAKIVRSITTPTQDSHSPSTDNSRENTVTTATNCHHARQPNHSPIAAAAYATATTAQAIATSRRSDGSAIRQAPPR